MKTSTVAGKPTLLMIKILYVPPAQKMGKKTSLLTLYTNQGSIVILKAH